MEINEVKIQVPEGMEAYLENNIIKFRAVKKKLTYEDIAKELFDGKDVWRIENFDIVKYNKTICWDCITNCVSEKQAQKLFAIKKLMDVAKYLNGNWKPDWDNEREIKYYIELDANKNTLSTNCNISFVSNIIYFKSTELAQQAIKILGEGTVRVALSTNW